MANKYHAEEAAKELKKALPDTKIEVVDVKPQSDQYSEDQKKRIKKARKEMGLE